MKKTKKESIVELTQLLIKAQEHIKQLLKQQEYASVLDLLQQCQQAAIQMGTIIEESEGEGFVTVTLLENYCELVFQTYQNVEGAQEEISLTEMQQVLDVVAESVENDLKVRRQVVFLPYKAAMWDCMESIWMAAKEDPECDVYVVPIPYYDKNPDGTVAKEHYEIDMYPEYVPVCRYDAFDFEEKADVMYIHNPYDQYNHVTTVHPFFYSYNIKKHTDKLVYVPYFVASYYESAEAGAAFIQTSGAIHADYVIAQSDLHKEFYVKSGYPSSKILTLGNPKLDAAQKKGNDRSLIPDEWKDIIEGKKVFLYNASIGTLLAWGQELYFGYMNYIFEQVTRDKDMVFIWRPHPLLEATIKSMRVHEWEVYSEFKKAVLDAPNAIYDDLPDAYVSIAASDAMFSDQSSLIFQYIATGKPVFFNYYAERVFGTIVMVFDFRGVYCHGNDKKREKEEICAFIEMIKDARDDRREERLSNMVTSTANADGTSGEKIHQAIMGM